MADDLYFDTDDDVIREESKRAILPQGDEGDDFEEIEEEPNLVTIKTLTPSTLQLKSLNLEPGDNTITFTVKSRLQGE